MPFADDPRPVVAQTRLGPVEYAESGEGPVVLSLHGAMGGYDQSAILARAVGPAGCRHVAVSRPGYLGTPLGDRGTPEAQADLCAALLDVLEVEHAAVMGISGGGPCALHFALRHAGRCRGLVLLSTCGTRVDSPLPFSYRILKYLARWPAVFGWMRKRAASDPMRRAARAVTDPVLLRRMLADPEAGPLFEALMASTADRLPQRLPGTANDIAVTRSTEYPLEDVAVPVLVVHGTKDPHLPFARHARTLAMRIPGAQLLAAEGGEHACLFTHRDLIRARVAQFLAVLAPPAGR
jgi:pimeloyl-ACP methyl ester carboxylesterase